MTTTRTLSLSLLIPLALVLAGCPTTDEIDHMEHQPKGKPYRPSSFFADGQLMRSPPTDTVPLEHDDGNLIGIVPDGGIAATSATIPYKVDADFMKLGKSKFDMVCATCHGFLGNGDSVVAHKMSLRPPPDITEAKYRALPDSEIFQIITNGFGYMNPYRDMLSSKERWAVVAYLRALQLSQNAPAKDLAADDIQHLNNPPAPAGPDSENRHE